MTDTEINLAVAQKLGFNLSPDGKSGCWHKTGAFISIKLLPNYAGDLNACAEMERVGLTSLTIPSYVIELVKIRGIQWGLCNSRERTTGFLKMHGLWKNKVINEVPV